MKVIVLTSGEYSDYGISGVFSSMAKAEAYVMTMQKGEGGLTGYNFEEYEADECSAESWQSIFACAIDVDGNLIRESTEEKLVMPDYSEVRDFLRSSTEFRAESSISADHARKLAAENRQSWLREVKNAKFYWRVTAIGGGSPVIEKNWYAEGHRDLFVKDVDRSDCMVYTFPGDQTHYVAFSSISAEDAIRKIEIARPMVAA